MKVLILGGAGYIGSVMVPAMLGVGYEVTVLDNFMYGQSSLNHMCMHPKFNVVRGDVRIDEHLKPLIKDADVIIPLAAIVGAPACDERPVEAVSTNFSAVESLLILISKDQRVIVPITNSAYGTSKTICTEESPVNPISLYAKTKVNAEKLLMERENSISLRLATVFGMSPRMVLDLLVNDLTYRAVTDRSVVLFEAHFKRNYVHVLDVAHCFIHAIENFEKMKGQIYNLGNTEANMNKKELCGHIKLQVPYFEFTEAPFAKDPDQRNYEVSNAKIEAAGFKAQVSIDDGIAELIKGFQMLRNTRYGNI